MSARASVIFAALLSTAAGAAPTIDPQYGDHAVIQRGKPIHLSGGADPGERVTVSLDNDSRSTRASAAGRWEVVLPARTAAGGSHSISVMGTNGTATSNDIAIGDVWLCSGQSNMEYPLRRTLNADGEVQNAADDDLRLLKIPQQLAPTPQSQFAKAPEWKRSTPDAAKDFSAACYFMVRDYRATQHVPIGAIDATWGGTPIRAWMGEAAVREGGNTDLANVVDLYRRDPAAGLRQFGETWSDWWRSKTGQAPGQEPWHASRRLAWKPVPKLTYWDEWGADWKAFDGSIWARKRVTLTAAEAAQPAKLSLGVVDDQDQTFVNGVTIGGTSDWSAERNYAVPPGVLKAGENEILVYVRDNWGPGGFQGPADKLRLSFANGETKPLGSGWQYAKIDASVGAPPVPPWDGPLGVSTIYNAMVAPLGPLGLTGVAWYQGEADVGEAGYDRRLAAWMADWRAQFRDSRLPFLIVGLAGWGPTAPEPRESGWASLINEQRLAAERDPRAALASAIDLGVPADIHPANKQEVGRRLALAGRALAYPKSGGKVGPLPVRAARQGNLVVISFTKPLQSLSGSPVGFELCGPSQGSCRFANARVAGSDVQLALDGRPVTRVRYAWADYPIINLYDEDMLPAPVFELPVN